MVPISAILTLVAFILAIVVIAQGPRSLLAWAVFLLALSHLIASSLLLLR